MPELRVRLRSVPGVRVLLGLQPDEQETEQERRCQEDLEHGAVSGAQRVMRDRDRDTGDQQDGGVDRGQAEGRDGFELAAHVARPVGRPRRLVPLPGKGVGEELGALATQPRDRELARIKERAEERREEHDLGEDEPHHPHAERAVDTLVVETVLALVDHRAEPADEHVDHRGQPEHKHPAPRGRVHQEQRHAEHRREERHGSDRRPLAAMRDVVLGRVVNGLCVRHGSNPSPASCTSSRRASCGRPAPEAPDRR